MAMLVQATLVEKACRRPVMSGIQDFFSAGGIAGAGCMAFLLSRGVSPLNASFTIIGFIALLFTLYSPKFLRHGGDTGPVFAIPHGNIVFLGLIGCVIYLVEGLMLDWRSIALSSLHRVPRDQAGIGYMVFACAMVVGRLSGDKLVQILGQGNLLRVSIILTSIGLILLGYTSSVFFGFLSLLVIGAGASNIVPVILRAAGGSNIMPPGLAIAAIATLGYLGVFGGPGLTGYIVGMAGLKVAIPPLALCVLCLLFFARTVEKIVTH